MKALANLLLSFAVLNIAFFVNPSAIQAEENRSEKESIRVENNSSAKLLTADNTATVRTQAAGGQSASPRSNNPDYRIAASVHNLSNEQLNKIDAAFDAGNARLRSGTPIAIVRSEFYAEIRKCFTPEQIKELDSFKDPLSGINNLKVERDIPYVIPADPMRVGDLYLPKNKTGKIPAVIFIHGGGWSQGSKEQSTHTAVRLAQHGFAVFNINYRLVGAGGEFPADLIDVKDALAFVVSKASDWNIDTSKIAAMGGSAGAHLSMMLGYTDNNKFRAEHYPKSNTKLVAVVSWFGPVEMANDHGFVMNYLAKGDKDVYHDASPISYVDTAVPTLFVHGTDDPLVSISHSERLDKALTEHHITSELLRIPGAKHGFRGEDWNAAINKTIEFLDKQFGMSETKPKSQTKS